ncbi:ABC transporter permease [Xylanimonas sp. McL0601]|uniref:ABC transporter permease n=1 Tax=Xylanimonas sp. McL0601 TaxID=3414739 RepID=UPI003CF3C883
MTTSVVEPVETRLRQRPAEDTLAALGDMSRLFWRRNRVRLVVWAVFVIGMVGYVIRYYQGMFTTQASLDDFATISNNPGIKALTGLAANPATLGGAVWTKIWMFVAISLALGAVFLVTRNGRADEELGRTELLRSRVLGLHAHSAAAWLWVAGLCVVGGIGSALVSIGMGLDPEGAGVMGSLVFGASITGVGLFGLGVGAVAGQVASTSRGANALGSIVVIAFYVLRMVGDLGNGALTWASPIGWGQEMQPWGANRWWPLLLLVVLTVALLAAAWRLEAHRDHGAGLLPDRPGKASAPARFASPLGLALRLQRGAIAGWAIAVVLCAGLFGSVVQAMTDLLKDATGSATKDLIGGTTVDALLSMLISLIALVVAVFAVQSTVSLRGDEAGAILEPQLAGAIGRMKWALQRLAIPVVGSAVLLVVGGGIFGASYGSTVSDSSQAGRLAGAALAYWPAIMVLVGVSVLLFGYLPRLAVSLSWGVIAAVWFLMFVGDALGLPHWLLDSLPWSATPYVPLEPLRWTPLVVMTVVAAAFLAVGLDRFRRRDVVPA